MLLQDGYRIVDFCERDGPSPVDGRVFYINPDTPDTERPCANLLRDHFRQCLVANLGAAAAAAEPHAERPFDPELDLLKAVLT